jgi:hypothetical protein
LIILGLRCELGTDFEVKGLTFIRKKDWLAAVASLDDMMRNPGNDKTCDSRHGKLSGSLPSE